MDRFKELLVVEESVVGDARARNDVNGPWSFRRRMTDFASSPDDAVALTVKWLSSWKSPTKVNLFDVAARTQVQQKALCTWLRANPSNGCDATCAACTKQDYDLAYAPFRLIAMVNRADLIELVDDPSAFGEARFVYGLVNGPGDAAASQSQYMAVIFEYRQPLRGRTRLDVARQWHALGGHNAFDESYKADLEALLTSFSGPGVEPQRPRGSAINQVRTNEREFDWQWDMREFTLTSDGLELNNLENTPDRTLIGSQQFADFLRGNRDGILKKRHVMPSGLAGGSIGLEKWLAPGADSQLIAAFNDETCNGCHQLKPLDFNFQVSPFKRGRESVSAFLNDPNDPSKDALAHRENLMRRVLCQP